MTHNEQQVSTSDRISNGGNDRNIKIGNTAITLDKSTATGGSTASFSTPHGRESPPAPEEKAEEVLSEIKLTLLLVSGERHTFKFEPSDTIETVKKSVLRNWPKEWADEAPKLISSLKIIYLGKFLEDGTLESNKIQPGQTTIAHLTIKNELPPNNDDPKSTDNAPKCQCLIL